MQTMLKFKIKKKLHDVNPATDCINALPHSIYALTSNLMPIQTGDLITKLVKYIFLINRITTNKYENDLPDTFCL